MIRTLLLACLSILLVATIIYRPDDAFQASLQGLTIWWNIVFPGLLPFLTLLELMLAFGAVHPLEFYLNHLCAAYSACPEKPDWPLPSGGRAGFPLARNQRLLFAETVSLRAVKDSACLRWLICQAPSSCCSLSVQGL